MNFVLKSIGITLQMRSFVPKSIGLMLKMRSFVLKIMDFSQVLAAGAIQSALTVLAEAPLLTPRGTNHHPMHDAASAAIRHTVEAGEILLLAACSLLLAAC